MTFIESVIGRFTDAMTTTTMNIVDNDGWMSDYIWAASSNKRILSKSTTTDQETYGELIVKYNWGD